MANSGEAIVWRDADTQFVDSFKRVENSEILVDNLIKREDRKDVEGPGQRLVPFATEVGSVSVDFSDLCDKVDLTENNAFGRHVVARAAIETGTKIGEAKPFAAVVDQSNRRYCLACHNTKRETYITCENCNNAVFCTETCRQTNQTHRYECGSNFHSIKYGDNLAIKCAMQMVFETLNIYNDDVESLKEDVDGMLNDENGVDCTLSRPIDDGRSKFETIMRLRGRTDKYLELRVQQAYATITQLTEINRLFNSDEKRTFLKLLLANFLRVFANNSFTWSLPKSDADDDNQEEVKRTTIFDTFSLFNHSCSPNVIPCMEWDRMMLITSRPIKQDEQLCINYRYFDKNTKTEDRRANLKNSWNFVCNCERCAYDGEIDDDVMENTNKLDRVSNFRLFGEEMNEIIQNERDTDAYWTPLIGACGLKYHIKLIERNQINRRST